MPSLKMTKGQYKIFFPLSAVIFISTGLYFSPVAVIPFLVFSVFTLFRLFEAKQELVNMEDCYDRNEYIEKLDRVNLSEDVLDFFFRRFICINYIFLYIVACVYN